MANGKFYGTRDLMTMFGWDVRYAEQVMHMFDHCGQMYRIGRRLYVKKSYFDGWLELQKGGMNGDKQTV